MLLTKGFEIELYTGKAGGDIVGLSDRITADLEGFMREPDSRNVEYATPPLRGYDSLLPALVYPRLKLRDYLKMQGDYTVIPGSTLALGGSGTFFRSTPGHPYHSYIERTYGTDVVTASVHINIGISDLETLLRACRLIRAEAPLYLALSASSPFLNGAVTGAHSTRWHLFPKTPAHVPLFESHAHYIQWTEAQLAAGTMQNVRHLWSSVRPNGEGRPYDLNRLELRICDLVSDPIRLLGITALLEARLWQLMFDPSLDPLVSSTFPLAQRGETLLEITEANEASAALNSLDATLNHWQDGRQISARDWILEIYDDVVDIAAQKGFRRQLQTIHQILQQGNEAQQWLRGYAQGADPRALMAQSVQSMQARDLELADLIRPLSVA